MFVMMMMMMTMIFKWKRKSHRQPKKDNHVVVIGNSTFTRWQLNEGYLIDSLRIDD